MTPLTAKSALDGFFLEARSKILDLAAVFDRIDRGQGSTEGDPRLVKLREALQILLGEESARAERVQQVFSLEYDPMWTKPRPRV